MNTERMLAGLAEILEVPVVTEATDLDTENGWDSLAIVCTVALIDDNGGAQVSGPALAACKTVGDVLALAKGREVQNIGADEVRDVGDLFGDRSRN